MLCPTNIKKKKEENSMHCTLQTDQDQKCSKKVYKTGCQDHTLLAASVRSSTPTA